MNRNGIRWVYGIVRRINKDLEEKTHCSAAYLDNSQAIDKVWHNGLFYNLKKRFTTNHIYLILQSYLSKSHFLVKHQGEYIVFHSVKPRAP